VVVAFRHALAPGTFDPPEFTLGDCRTQRNLSDEGRAQAKRIGRWFDQRSLKVATVRSSPWCRCLDTATLAFGRGEPWAALGSPVGRPESSTAESQRELRRAIETTSRQPGRIEVWVTHQFVLTDLAGVATTSGEGLLLRAVSTSDKPQLLGRLLVDS
jgi:Histidine phosphatase superfamily (branch 1)